MTEEQFREMCATLTRSAEVLSATAKHLKERQDAIVAYEAQVAERERAVSAKEAKKSGRWKFRR
jgi:hypothetical protein